MRSTFRLTATADHFARYAPTFLANGCFSSGSSLRGTDAALTLVAGLMDRAPGDVSRPAAIPSWTEIDCFNGTAWLNATPVTPEAFRDYRQTLDMYDGVLDTSYTWVAGGRPIQVTVTTLVSQSQFHLAATRLTLTPLFSGPLSLRIPLRAWPAPARLPLARLSWTDLKDALVRNGATQPLPAGSPRPAPPPAILTWFDLQEALAADGLAVTLPNPAAPTRAAVWYPGEVRTTFGVRLDDLLLTADGAAPNGSAYAEAVAVDLSENLVALHPRVPGGATGAGVILEMDAEVRAGEAYRCTKYVSISGDGWEGGLSRDVERAAGARAEGFERLLAAHTAAWHEVWTSDIIVDVDPDLQRVIHSDLFSLLQNTNPDVSWPVGACGMSPNYFGHVFWDSDNWVFPVLLLLHPDRAGHLLDFRSRTLPWAKASAARQGLAGAAFPWEADPENGTEQTPHFAGVNAEREIHLNADIAIAQWQHYLATGDRGRLREHAYPVIEAAADYYVSRAAYDRDRDRYELRHVVSVDEKYTDVDNDIYTNAAVRTSLEIAIRAAATLGLTPHAGWQEVAAKLYLPFSEIERRHLVFDSTVPHDRRTWMAGGLGFLTAPYLDLPMPADVRRNDYEYAVRKVADLTGEPNQMMLGMLAVHAATLGDAAAAQRWLQSVEHELLKPPFNLRSETPHNNCMPLLAASGGILQALLYGFTGLRITEDGLVGAYPPVLPDGWTALTVQGLRFRGDVFDAIVVRDGRGRATLTLASPATSS